MTFGNKRCTTVSHAVEERAEKNAFESCGSFFMCVASLLLIERSSLLRNCGAVSMGK